MKNDWKDDIFSGTSRKYTMTNNDDGTVSFADATEYTQQGDILGAKQMNEIGDEVNRIQDATDVTFPASGWTGSEAPYEQTVSVNGITADDKPVQGIKYPTGCTAAQMSAIKKAVGYIYDLETGDGTVTLRAVKKPTTDFTLSLKGVN